MKLRGKEIELRKPTMADRIRINNIGRVELDQKNNRLTVTRGYEQTVEWARVGLGLKLEDIEKLNEYTDEEIAEIAEHTKELINVNPTKGASSN